MPSANPDVVIRRLTAADFGDADRLLTEAFGPRSPANPPPTPESYMRPGRHSCGAFIDGEMVAHASGNEFASWVRAVEVPTCGVGGVTVVAERPGTGLLHGLVTAVLGEASARGEAISTLFPTAPGVYRRLGYEVVGSYDTVSVPAVLLASVAAPAATTTRRHPHPTRAPRRHRCCPVRVRHVGTGSDRSVDPTHRPVHCHRCRTLGERHRHHRGRGRRRSAGRVRDVEPHPRPERLSTRRRRP